jgi:hypothetical protein
MCAVVPAVSGFGLYKLLKGKKKGGNDRPMAPADQVATAGAPMAVPGQARANSGYMFNGGV